MNKIKTAKQLQNQYEKDLNDLQKSCKHKKATWCEEWWAPAHATGWEVLSCKTCWKIVKRRTKCPSCGKEFTVDEDEYKQRDFLDFRRQGYCCKECYSKYDYSVS